MDNNDYVERLVKVEQRASSNSHRIEAVEKNQEAINRLATSVEVMVTEQKHTNEKLDSVSDKVDTLERRPGDRWNTATVAAITALVAGVVGYVISLIL